ncbi:DUF4236 domain-containing protein [Flavobacterium collinsii]|uniref:DUF4236 domain-containing protein n=1 Tax=Flavobacterium collinsii TaxID=1114861 RepID=UPI0035712151
MSQKIIFVMGFRFRKRIKLGGGFGLNLSKSGISPSLRTKMGTFSKSGYSVKTGISGLRYQNSGCTVLIAFTGIITLLIFTLKQL